jgi:hypothetical protein
MPDSSASHPPAPVAAANLGGQPTRRRDGQPARRTRRPAPAEPPRPDARGHGARCGKQPGASARRGRAAQRRVVTPKILFKEL